METIENASYSFVDKLLITMAFKFVIGVFLTVINKGFVLKRRLKNNTILLEQCERLSFLWNIHLKMEQCETGSVFINKNGQERKRSSLNVASKANF